MQISITPLSDRLLKITLAGRLDTPGVDRVETRFIASLVPDANSAIVDLSQVDFVASMGIRMFVSTARGLSMKKAALAIYGAQEQVSDVFNLVSLQQIIPIVSTEAEALAAVGSPLG